MSRERLGRLIGITGAQLYRIETGRSATRLVTAWTIARVLGENLGRRISIEDIFPEENAS